MGLGAVPSCFGWELVEWKPLVHQSRAEIGGKSAKVLREVHDVVEVGDDTSEEGKVDLNWGTGDAYVHEIGSSDSIFEDYPGNSFEKMGGIDLEEGPQTPIEPVPSISSDETLTREGPRKKRVKTLAGCTDLPWVRKLLAQQFKSSPLSRQPSVQTKQPTQPTRKSYRLASQGFSRRSSTTKQGPPVVEEIESSSEGSPIKRPETATPTQVSPVPGSEQASIEISPLHQNKHLLLDLFLKGRPLPNTTLQQNRPKNPNPNGSRLRFPPHQIWKNFSRAVL